MGKDKRVSFSKYFGVSKAALAKADFFDISLISDTPLFIDPFHLFHSDKKEYEALHDEIIKYLSFLRDYSVSLDGKSLSSSDIERFFRFPEVKQNWLGYCYFGNSGHGLGKKFANALNNNFYKLFNTGTPGHLEKLALVTDRVGKDNISDFSTNLIHAYLAKETEKFTKDNIKDKNLVGTFTIKKAEFDYKTKSWKPKSFLLPKFDNDYVLLTPRDLLTKEDTWINKGDLIDEFNEIPYAMSNEALRDQLIDYLNQKLIEYSETKIDKKTGEPKLVQNKKTRQLAIKATILKYPETIDVYISKKEERGEIAEKISANYIAEIEAFKENQHEHFISHVDGSRKKPTTLDEARDRANYFKGVVETDLYVDFYDTNGNPASEDWVQRQFLYVWGGTLSDVYREAVRGPGKTDYIISNGSEDKCVVEFKLASSSSLENNLRNQLDEYKKLNKAQHGLWIIIVYNDNEYQKVQLLIKKLKLNVRDIIVVDVRKNNKIPPSKLK